jgi:alkylhydroperoxidase family enzyme
MSRIPFVRDSAAGPPELVEKIRARRAGKLLNLDRMLLHSPGLARGWNEHLGAIRTGLSLNPQLRELAICSVAVLNGADYEFEQHLPHFIEAGGSEHAAEALRSFESARNNDALFSEAERATMNLTLEMTRSVAVSDETFARARSAMGADRYLVELVGVIATYNMVSRFLVALGVESEAPR